MPRVLDVGQCGLDHGSISRLLRANFKAEVVQADTLQQTMAALANDLPFDLVLVNRKLDQDYSDGLAIIQAMKADPKLSAVPVMLVSNYPESQAQAVADGAEPGFGKSALHAPQTLELLGKYLGG